MTHHAARLLRTLALTLIDTADRIDPPPPFNWTDHITDLYNSNPSERIHFHYPDNNR